MTTTTIDPYGNRSNGSDDSPIFKKIKEIISDLKKGSVSQNSRIERSIEKLTTVGINSTQNAKATVNSAVVKTTNAGYIFLKTILFLITIAVSVLFFAKIYDLITKLSLALNNSYFQPITLGWISITLTLLIIINLLILLFPFTEGDTKTKIMAVEGKILIILIFGLIIFNVFGISSFFTNYTTEEKTQIVTENVKTNTVSFWDKIGCYITLNQECITDKLTTKTAENTQRTTYSLSLEKPLQISKPLDQWQLKPLTLNYKIASSGELTLDRIECYQEKIDQEHLLSNITLNNRIINTDGQITDLPGIQCNLEKLNVKGDKKTEDITIIPVLYLTLNTTYTLKIPIILEKLYTEQTGEKGPIAYLDYKTIEYMRKNNKNFEIKQSNNALNFAVKGVTNGFPLVYGNNDPLSFDIPIEISENPSNPLGKIETIVLSEEPNIPSYFTYQTTSNENLFSKSTDGNKILMDIYLTENEGQAETIELPLIITNIDMKLKSTLKKEDMTTRFKITIRDIPLTNQQTRKAIDKTKKTYTQLINDYTQTKNNYENLKNTDVANSQNYANIISKIDEIIPLLQSLSLYENKQQITPEETTIINQKTEELNLRLEEFNLLIKELAKPTIDSPMP